jgi:hypothetical protein
VKPHPLQACLAKIDTMQPDTSHLHTLERCP